VKLDPQDATLLAARDAFEANQRTKLATLAPQLKGHLLEPYVEYWQLFFRLPGASAEDVRDFLSRYPGTALAEQLRARLAQGARQERTMGVVSSGVSGALRRRPRGDVLHAARALEARGRFGARRFQALLETRRASSPKACLALAA